MPNPTSPADRQSFLTVGLTNRCPLQCAHCGPESGPRQHGALALDQIAQALDVFAARGGHIVNFTGGEPFILGAALDEVVRLAATRGLWSRVQTGAYWSRTDEAAFKRLEPLAAAGLNQICLSTTEDHQVFVPLANLVHAKRAADRLRVNVIVNVSVSANGPVNRSSVQAAFVAGGVPVPPILETGLIPLGRAGQSLGPERQRLLPVSALDGPCPSMTRHPIVFDDGNVAGCAGVFVRNCPSLHFGNVHDDQFDVLLDRINAHPLARWLHDIGVVALKNLIEQESPLRFGDRFVNICHLCGTMMNHPEAQMVLQRLGLLEPLQIQRGVRHGVA